MNFKQVSKDSIVVSAISNWATLIIQTLIGLALTPFLINYLGENGYGSWIAIISVWGYFGIITTGIGSSVIRYIAKYKAQEDVFSLNKVVNSSFFLVSLFALMMIPVSYLGGGVFAIFFKIKTSGHDDFIKAFFYMGMATVIMFYVANLKSVAHGFEFFKDLNVMESVYHIIRASLIYFLLREGLGLIGIAYANLLGYGFFLAMIVWFFKFNIRDIAFKIKYISKNEIWSLMSYSGGSLLISFANILRFNLDNLIIARLVNMEMVAVYSIGAALINYIAQFIIMGFGILMPRFTSLIAVKGDSEVQTLLLKSLFISSFLSVMMSTVSVVMVDDFLAWWLKKEFIQSATIFYILIFSFSVSLAGFPGISLFYAKNKHLTFAKMTLVEAMINFALSIILVMKIGFIGAAISTAITLLLSKLFIQPYFVCKMANIPMVDYYKQIVTPYFAGGVIVIVAFYSGFLGENICSFPFMVMGGLILMAAYYWLMWLLLILCKSPNACLIKFWNFKK